METISRLIGPIGFWVAELVQPCEWNFWCRIAYVATFCCFTANLRWKNKDLWKQFSAERFISLGPGPANQHPHLPNQCCSYETWTFEWWFPQEQAWKIVEPCHSTEATEKKRLRIVGPKPWTLLSCNRLELSQGAWSTVSHVFFGCLCCMKNWLCFPEYRCLLTGLNH